MKQSHWVLISIAAGVAGVLLYKRFLEKTCKCKEKNTALPIVKGTVTGANLQSADVSRN